MKTRLLFIFILGIMFGADAQTTCIGTKGQVKWEYWSNAPSTDVPDSNALFALENYPNNPDGFEIISSTRSPRNYTNNFSGVIKGFIKVDTTASYLFNVTGDDKGMFLLSPNANASQKVKRASFPQYTAEFDHAAYSEQTSQFVQLLAGQYYYFELLYFEGGGGDGINLYWKKSGAANYSIIDFNFLYQYNCGITPCPPRGTTCNDGVSTTTNDQQDGFCNCVGKPATANACVGEKGLIEAYYYNNITGGYVENDLINSPKFPLIPDRRENLRGANGPLVQYTSENYGTLVQGFLTVPVSGTYEFNITGDNQTFFFMSKNDSIQYKQNHQMVVIFGLGEFEHNNSVLQNSGPIFMEKGKYYYFEFRHKENNWRDHFTLFWKTPFHSQKRWKKIPNFYLYDYNCEIACIAVNTPCDDGNAFTNNDKINASCDCVGTPCAGAGCADLGAAYQSFTDCSPTNNLSPISEASWVSCTTAPNPNTARAQSHWIKYNFEDVYKFKTSRIWNYNVISQTTKGFNTVVVDYSMDGVSWTQLGGVYTWGIAPAQVDYAGITGPNFNDVKAKYILITALTNHGDGTCAGISKVTFDALLCNPKDTPCDDNDPLTSYDKFDANCNCRGVDVNCASDSVALGTLTLSTGTFQAKKRIESISKVPSATNISFTAGNSIVLLPGFEARNASIFKAEIKNCIQQQITANISESENKALELNNEKLISTDSVQIIDSKVKTIIFRLNEPGQVNLSLKDAKGNIIVTLIDGYQENLGTQIKYIPTQKLPKGTYEIVLTINKNVVSEKFEVL